MAFDIVTLTSNMKNYKGMIPRFAYFLSDEYNYIFLMISKNFIESADVRNACKSSPNIIFGKIKYYFLHNKI